MSWERRLEELNLRLSRPAKPVGSYVPAVRAGKLLFTSGQLPFREGKLLAIGKVPSEVPLETAREAARQAVLNALSALQEVAGSLDRVARIVRLAVYVNSAPGFTDPAQVANAASELLVEIFGPCGRHARTTVGVAELPLNAPVELDLVAELA